MNAGQGRKAGSGLACTTGNAQGLASGLYVSILRSPFVSFPAVVMTMNPSVRCRFFTRRSAWGDEIQILVK